MPAASTTAGSGSNAWRTRSITSWSGVRNRVVGAMRRTISRFTNKSAKNSNANTAPSSTFVQISAQKTDVNPTSRNHSRST